MSQVGAQSGPKGQRKFRHPLAHLTLAKARPFTEFIQEVLHLRNESEIEGALRGNEKAAKEVVRQCIKRGRLWMLPFSVPVNGGPAYQDTPIVVGMLDHLTTDSVSVQRTICKDSKGNRLNMSIYDYARKATGLDLRKRNLPAVIATGEEFPNSTLFEFPVEMLRIATREDGSRPVSHGIPTYPTGDAVQALFGRKRPYQESETARSSRTNSPVASGSRQYGRSEEPLQRMSFEAAYVSQNTKQNRSRTPSRPIRSPGGTAVGAPRPEIEVIELDTDRIEMLEQQVEELRGYYTKELERLNGKFAEERQKRANVHKQLTEVNQKAWDWSHVANEARTKLEAAEKNVEMYRRRCVIAEGEAKLLKDRIKQLESAIEEAQAATASAKEGEQEAQAMGMAQEVPAENSEEGQYDYYSSEENDNQYGTLVNNQEPKGPETPPGGPGTPTEEDLLKDVVKKYDDIDEAEVLKEEREEGEMPQSSPTPPLIMPPDAPTSSATYQIEATGWANGYVGSFESDAEPSTSSAAATASSTPSQAEAATPRPGLS